MIGAGLASMEVAAGDWATREVDGDNAFCGLLGALGHPTECLRCPLHPLW